MNFRTTKMSPPTRATKTSTLKSRPITKPDDAGDQPAEDDQRDDRHRDPLNPPRHAREDLSHCHRPYLSPEPYLFDTASALDARDAEALRGGRGPRRPLSDPLGIPRDRRSALRRREHHHHPQVLADVVELVGHPGRHVHDAAARHLGRLHTDGDRAATADDEVDLVLLVRLLRVAGPPRRARTARPTCSAPAGTADTRRRSRPAPLPVRPAGMPSSPCPPLARDWPRRATLMIRSRLPRSDT